MNDEPQPATETEVIVLDEHRERQKHNYASVARLAQARTQVQTVITHLEKDYSTREIEFWQKAIACVLGIREAIRPYQGVVTGADIFPVNLMELQFKLMVRAGHIETLVDGLGIIITAYQPGCQSMTENNLRQHNTAPKVVHVFRLFDCVRYHGQVSFVFGRRSSGYFDLQTLDGAKARASASSKKLTSVQKASACLVERRSCVSSLSRDRHGVSTPRF